MKIQSSTWTRTATALTLLAALPASARPADSHGPPAVRWARSYDVAVERARETGKPLLLCVNMDDETANDELAARTYRDAEFVLAAEGTVPVIASAFRHDEGTVEIDASGRRLCPRFGTVTCDEHVAIERELRARWFAGRPEVVAPQHILADSAERALAAREYGLTRDDLCELVEAAIVVPTEPDRAERFHRDRLKSVVKRIGSRKSSDREEGLTSFRLALTHGFAELALEAAAKAPTKTREKLVRGLVPLGMRADAALAAFLEDRVASVRVAAVETVEEIPAYCREATRAMKALSEKERHPAVKKALRRALEP